MSTADILGTIAIVVGVLGIVAAVYYGNRALRPPKRLIQWYSDATPLMASGHAQYQGTIEVRVLGQKVDDPYIGRLTVENAGRHDIESNSFDQGRPIRFEVHHAKKTGTFLDQANPPGLRVAGNSILIGPELLHSKSKWTVSFVTDGRPEMELAESHLVNVNMRHKPATTELSTGAPDRNLVKATTALVVATVIAPLIVILFNFVIH